MSVSTSASPSHHSMPSSSHLSSPSSRMTIKSAKDLPPSSCSTSSSSPPVDERKDTPPITPRRVQGRQLELTGTRSLTSSPVSSARARVLPSPLSSSSSSFLPSSATSSPIPSPSHHHHTRQQELARVPVLRCGEESPEMSRGVTGPAASSSPLSASSFPSSPAHHHHAAQLTPRHFHASPSAALPPRSPIAMSSSLHHRTSSSPSVSPFSTPQSSTRSLQGFSVAHRSSLISINTARASSATSSPVSGAMSPCHTPPRMLSSSRRGSMSALTVIPARQSVLSNQDLLFATFDYLEFTHLFAVRRVCQRWNTRLGGEKGSVLVASSTIPTSYSMDFAATQTTAKGAGPVKAKRRSLMDRFLSSFACSVPTSPTDDGESTTRVKAKRTLDDSDLPVIKDSMFTPSLTLTTASALSLRNSSKHHDYFLRRSTAELTSLPTTAPHRAVLLQRLRHVRHLHFSRRAERRLDGEWIAGLIDALQHSTEKLLSLSLCGCSDATEFGVGTPHGPLLSPSFLSGHAISHQKKKPVSISDSSFALLFCPSTSAACFSALTSLSLANCHHLNDSSLLLLSSFPALQSLNLSHCLQISDDTVESIVRHHPTLTELNLSSCRSLTNATPYYLSSFLFATLASLNLSGLGLINDAGVAHLAAMTRLHTLQLRQLEFITDKGVVGLSACDRLTSLDLSECPFVSSKALSFLSLYLKLESLNLTGCTLLNDRGVHYIASTRLERRISRTKKEDDGVEQAGTTAGGGVDDHKRKEKEEEERELGLIPASELMDIVGLDEDDDDSSWIVPSKAPSTTSSPALKSRGLDQRALARALPPLLSSRASPSHSSFSPVVASLGCSPLRHLSLSKCSLLTDQAVRQLTTYSPLLVSLDLSFCSSLTDSSVMLLATGMTQLTTLSLSGCTRLTNIALLSLSSMRLRHLSLNSLPSIGEDGIAHLCSSAVLMTSLRSLSLNDLPKLTDSAVHLIATTFTTLQSLSVSQCPLVTDQSAFHVSIFLPHLIEFACQANEGLSDEGFRRLARLRSIQRIDVSHCRRLTSAALLKCIKTPKTAAERLKEEKVSRARDKRRQKEKDAMVKKGEMTEDEFEDEVEDETADGVEEWSDSLQLLVLRGCSAVAEPVIEQARKIYKRLKIVH